MRVLIISAFFPPLNNIASQRIAAFEKYLKQMEHQVDVITRYYDLELISDPKMNVYEKSPSGMKDPYIRKDNVIYTNYDEITPKKKKFDRMPPLIKGLYSYLSIDVYSYGWLKYVEMAFANEFSKNKYDFIIASYGPPITLLAAKSISNKYNIPFIADFRDIFINEKDKGYHLSMKKWQQRFLLSKSSGLLFVSEGMKDFFKQKAGTLLNKIPSAMVMNGWDEPGTSKPELSVELMEQLTSIQSRHSVLLLHTGTVYPDQEMRFFTSALKKLNETLTGKKAAILFVGLPADIRDSKELAGENVYFIPKVNLQTSLYLQKLATALLIPVWHGRYTGFSGKLFEYIGSGNTVLVGPGMQKDVVDFTSNFRNVIHLKDYNDFNIIVSDLTESTRKQNIPVNHEKLTRAYWVKQLEIFLIALKKQN
ncbi:MAG TPA: hypothetical protein VK177_02640 [Flavobacteriales bacterium]|nr:hypothetical protein [Flavobacteriales bacterium]